MANKSRNDMSEAKHTPGPWYFVPHSDDSGGHNVLTEPHQKAGIHHPTSDFICSSGVCPNPWQHGAVEAQANARLIAAAPDLLRALQALVERVDMNGGLGEYRGGPGFALSNARKAITRAING